MTSGFRSKRHEMTFKRNTAKGFFTATLTRTRQLMREPYLYKTERDNLRRMEIDLAWSARTWEKLPPGYKEEKSGKTND